MLIINSSLSKTLKIFLNLCIALSKLNLLLFLIYYIVFNILISNFLNFPIPRILLFLLQNDDLKN